MATGNFYNRNASKIFAIIPRCSVEDGCEEDCTCSEYYDWDDQLDWTAERLAEAANKIGADWDSRSKGEWDQTSSRSYPSRIIGTMSLEKDYSGYTVGVSITAVRTSGYYEGANLDWNDPEYTAGSNWMDDVEYITDDIEWVLDCSRKMAEHKGKFAIAWAEKAREKLITAIEEAFAACTIPLVVTARFSNGETWYGKADEPRNVLKSAVA